MLPVSKSSCLSKIKDNGASRKAKECIAQVIPDFPTVIVALVAEYVPASLLIFVNEKSITLVSAVDIADGDEIRTDSSDHTSEPASLTDIVTIPPSHSRPVPGHVPAPAIRASVLTIDAPVLAKFTVDATILHAAVVARSHEPTAERDIWFLCENKERRQLYTVMIDGIQQSEGGKECTYTCVVGPPLPAIYDESYGVSGAVLHNLWFITAGRYTFVLDMASVFPHFYKGQQPRSGWEAITHNPFGTASVNHKRRLVTSPNADKLLALVQKKDVGGHICLEFPIPWKKPFCIEGRKTVYVQRKEVVPPPKLHFENGAALHFENGTLLHFENGTPLHPENSVSLQSENGAPSHLEPTRATIQ